MFYGTAPQQNFIWPRVPTIPMEQAVRETVFRGRILGLSVYEGTIEGRPVRREIIEHPGAAAMLAFDDDGMVVMVNQHRFPRGRVLEIPAGTLEEGESPRECALRELEEETGYAADSMEPLLAYYPSIGYNTEKIHCFVATGLRRISGASPDEDEIISVERHSIKDILEMIRNGRIEDSKTICAVLAYASGMDGPAKPENPGPNGPSARESGENS